MTVVTEGPAGQPAASLTAFPQMSGRFRAAMKLWPLVQVAGLFTLFAGLLAFVQYGSTALVGTDGYYHARMGLLVRQEGLRPDFEWLPLTILNAESFYDHHLLYHVYLALFAGVEPMTDGGQALTQAMKVASIVLPALAFLAVWWLLRSQGVRWASFWALGLLAMSEAFLYRMSMPRAQSAALLVLVLGLHWLLTRRYRLLLPLGFAFVWLYDGFPLLLVIGAIYLAAAWMVERDFAWQAVAFPLAGIVLGLLVNPYFPQNIHFTLNHLLPKILLSDTPVGNEWYPYETWTLVQNSGYALAAFMMGVLAIGWQKERISRPVLTVLIITIFFGFLLFKSRRFVEYFPAFVLIFATLSIAPLFQGRLESKGRWQTAAPLILIAVLAVPMVMTLSLARDSVAGSKSADLYAEASLWLAANAPEDSFVFQTDWDDFPRLFFYNPRMIYTVGLDPTYMELHNASLYEEWVEITQGKVADMGAAIAERFDADYVFSDLNHDSFLRRAADDPVLLEIYRDDTAVIFKVDSAEATVRAR